MQLGCCGPIEQADAVKAAGFDFLEVNIQKTLQGEADDAAWAATAPDPASLPLPIHAANCLVPGSLPIVADDRDPAALRTYMQRVGKRAAVLGIKRLVFGSGGARKRPDSVSEDQSDERIVEFLKIAGDACEPHGVMVVIEHLRQAETNTLNALADCQRLCDRAGHPAVSLLVDSFHFGVEQETDDALLALDDRIDHVHVAEPIDRIQPGGHGAESDQAYDFVHFFTLLRKLGYDQGVSFEGKWIGSLAEQGPGVVEYLRHAWAEAGRDAD